MVSGIANAATSHLVIFGIHIKIEQPDSVFVQLFGVEDDPRDTWLPRPRDGGRRRASDLIANPIETHDALAKAAKSEGAFVRVGFRDLQVMIGGRARTLPGLSVHADIFPAPKGTWLAAHLSKCDWVELGETSPHQAIVNADAPWLSISGSASSSLYCLPKRARGPGRQALLVSCVKINGVECVSHFLTRSARVQIEIRFSPQKEGIDDRNTGRKFAVKDWDGLAIQLGELFQSMMPEEVVLH